MTNRLQSTPDYLRIYSGAPTRLRCLKNRALESYKGPHPGRASTWRDARAWGFHNWEVAFCTLNQGKQGNTPIWYTHHGEYFRNERDADDILSAIDHTGWFTDMDGSERAIGIIASLPHGRFLAGYRWTGNGERVYFPEVFTDAKEAARAADSYAEEFAEMAREDSERFDAMREAEDEVEHVEALLRKRLPGRNATGGLREEVRGLIEELRQVRKDAEHAAAAYERG